MSFRNPVQACWAFLFCLFAIPLQCALAHASGPDRPNIILINLDDADVRMMADDRLQEYYPAIWNLAQESIRFTNVHATSPFCGPSRAALMRGQYAFNTRIRNNRPTDQNSNGFPGGYEEFLAQGHHQNELGVLMRQAGYHTIHVGKYHHSGFDDVIPPGWIDIAATGGAKYFNNSRFTNIKVPEGERQAVGKDVYTTHLDRDQSIYFLNQHLDQNPDQPFFLYIAPLAPHLPTGGNPADMVEPKYANSPVPVFPADPNFNESDLSDKPFHLQSLSPFPMDKKQPNRLLEIQHGRVRSVKSVDDLVEALIASLAPNVLNNTWIFLTSDNGYLLGQHRLIAKRSPYQRCTNVPLLVRGPHTNGVVANHLLAHIDICPTILDLAEIEIPDFVDATSFRPLLEDPTAVAEPNWQSEILIENTSLKNNSGTLLDMTYTALRMYDSVYVGWANGETEYYDLVADPFQLENEYDSLPESQKLNLQDRLRNFLPTKKEPFTTVSFPFADPDFVSGRQVEFAGYCEDDNSIKRVFLKIQSASTGMYWNSDEWQTTPFTISFTPMANERPLTGWTRAETFFSSNGDGLECVIVSARSRDQSGINGPQSPETVFLIDFHPPNVSYAGKFVDGVKLPVGNVTLFGNANDNLQIAEVSMTVQDVLSGQYWDGIGFQSSAVWLTTELQNENWSVNLKLPAGLYEANVQAQDSATNQSVSMPLAFEVAR